MDLLLDLGNTRLKVAVRDAGGLRLLDAIVWDAGDFDARWQALILPGAVRVVAIASVAHAQRVAALRALLSQRLPQTPIVVAQTQAECLKLRIAYAQPDKLGVDRFLALLAATQDDTAQLIVGAGTALTVDALDAYGQHLGGLIVPGLRLMREAITQAAPGVNWSEHARRVDFAGDTASALESGVWQALTGVVERAAARLQQRIGGAIAVVAHGGDAQALIEALAIPVQHDALLVLRGLAAYLDAPMAQSRAATD